MRYQIKTPTRDGTTHVIFEPLDFIATLAAVAPKPRVNLRRYHGVFARNSQHRALVTPARPGKGNTAKPSDASQDQTPAEPRASMTSAWRLKRVFKIDIETCAVCASGTLRIIACIEDGALIDKILSYLDKKEHPQATSRLPPAFGRARPNPMTRSDLRPSR